MIAYKKIIFWLSAMLIIAGIQNLVYSQVNAKMTSHYTVKTCSKESDKNFLVTIGLDNISHLDSLFAFDILFEYDPNIVKIEGPIYQNTLSEGLFYKSVNIGYDYNQVRAFGYSDSPLRGNKELIGFFGSLKSDCPDSIVIKVLDFDLTEDFNKEYVLDSLITIIPQRVSDESKFVEVNLDRDSVIFSDDSLSNTMLSIQISPYNDIEEMFFDIDISDITNVEIYNIVSANENITVDYFEKVSNGKYEMKLRFWDEVINPESISIHLNELYKYDKDSIGFLKVTPRDFGNCNCYSAFKSDSTKLLSYAKKIDTSISTVNDRLNRDIKIYQFKEILEVESNIEDNINNVEIYDILGIKYNLDTKNSNNKYHINISSLVRGTYLLRVLINNKIVNKLIHIYN